MLSGFVVIMTCANRSMFLLKTSGEPFTTAEGYILRKARQSGLKKRNKN